MTTAEHAANAATGKITPSPGLVEAVASGEMTMPPAFTATPVDAQVNGITSGSSDATSPAATTAPSTSTKVVTAAPVATVATPSPKSAGETAVDTFQSSTAIANGKSSSSSGTLIGLIGGVACVAAIVVAVVYKKKARRSSSDDDDTPRQQPSHTTTCSFENADYTPGNGSIDGMLQDERAMAESIAMMPIFSAADRMDMSGGIVRLSSPFGATGVRISSPGGRGGASTDDMAFRADTTSQRSNGSLDARSTAHTIVHIKSEAAL